MIHKLALLAMAAIAPLAMAQENPSSTREAKNRTASLVRQAAFTGEQELLEFIDKEMLDERAFNNAFILASKGGYVAVMRHLLTLRNRDHLLNQSTINMAFKNAAEGRHVAVIEYLLTPNNCAPLPSQFVIIDAYREVNTNTRMDLAIRTTILNLLTPLVLSWRRQARQQDAAAGDAAVPGYVNPHEIHDYAATQVQVPLASSSSSTAIALNDAVIHIIRQRIGNKHIPNQSQIINQLHALIDAKYQDSTENAAAREVIIKGWNKNTLRRLGFVFSFLNTYHPDSFDVWMTNFINESLSAYNKGPSSCSKGIDERIVTGLRGIDAELDAIFQTPERAKMIKNFFASLNMRQVASAQRIANALMELKITTDSTIEQAASAYQAFLADQIRSHGGDVDSEYAEHIVSEISLLQDYYDEMVKPQIKILEDRAVREKQDKEYKENLVLYLAEQQRKNQLKSASTFTPSAEPTPTPSAIHSSGTIEGGSATISMTRERLRALAMTAAIERQRKSASEHDAN